MTVIPAGSFMMGRETDERSFVHAPAHEVTIGQPFAIGTFEVTWDEWQACVAAKRCTAGEVEQAGGDAGFGRGNRPVINVSWKDAMLYVRWLSKETGKHYRLPSDAEWEYAARAGSNSLFHFGDDLQFTAVCKYDNTADQSRTKGLKNRACSDGYGDRTAPVGSFRKNAFGLYDIHGNVAEWVSDCWHHRYDLDGGAPTDGSSWDKPRCLLRTVRLGSWVLPPKHRYVYARDQHTSSWRSNSLGFRVARELAPD
jgi:formylglycine-generating enzyme required for sulfatase activity